MALRKPLVMLNGIPTQIPSTDVLDAPLSEVDQVALINGEASPVTIGTPIYISAANTAKRAQANASGTTDAFAITRDVSIAASASGSFQTDGQLTATAAQWDAITGQTGGLTPGATYFLDAATAGKMTTTAPTTSGQFVLKLGKAVSTTIFDISIGQLIGL